MKAQEFTKNQVSNRGGFKFQGGKMLFNRLGPASPQKQSHREGNTAPVGRGIWAFPYPLNDFWFSFRQYEKLLPQKLQHDYYEKHYENWTDEEQDEYGKKRDDALREIQKRPENRLKKIWWDGPVYSHISAHGEIEFGQWYLFDTPVEFFEAARKELWGYQRWSETMPLFKGKYSVDHLEVFLPSLPIKTLPRTVG